MISIKDLSFSYGNERSKALDSVSIEIPDGQFVTITGPSGCGKSTLALAMGGYIPQVFEGSLEGSIEVDGHRTTEIDLASLATHIGIVQQDPEAQLCTLSVADEVAFGPENLQLPAEEVRERVDSSLAIVGASCLYDRAVYELSGGEKQRVAIASMLAMRPHALILDEPTSNLDPSCTKEVFQAIRSLRESSGMTIVIIEHKLDLALPFADRLIVMDHGKIALDGKPGDVIGRHEDMLTHMGIRLPSSRRPPLERVKVEKGERLVTVNGLKFSAGDREVLHGVFLDLHRSEVVGIMGPNGSGKTTFLLHLLGLNRPSSGNIFICGMDVSKTSTSALARKVGYVFQNPNHQLFERTVHGEAAFACKNFGFPDADARAAQALNDYGLSKYVDKHPLSLSYGEKRRLNICSVIPQGPEVVLMDEPFIGQDYGNVRKILYKIEALKREGKAVLLVSHDVEMVYEQCDRVVLFDSGRIIVDDVPENAEKMIRQMGKAEYLPGNAC